MVHDEDDPWAEFLRPPPNETPAQMILRQKKEKDATLLNDMIEEDIRAQRALAKKEKTIVRVLLLGQAESGKSTTLKNFRMQYDAEAWQKERNSWRTVVQLNLVRSVIAILSVIDAELGGEGPTREEEERPTFTDEHQLLLIRLSPLRALEEQLKQRLGVSADATSPGSTPMSATPFDKTIRKSASVAARQPMSDISVRCWPNAINPAGRNTDSHAEFDSPTVTLAERREDMKRLWEDSSIRMALTRQHVLLPDYAAYFLDSIERIACRDYTVTDEDIVHARLRTVGIQEYRLRLKVGPWDGLRNEGHWDWRMYDVGGCRTARAAWLPFFENTNVIIFLCPISCFDERLEEDQHVNRLEDSMILWRSICSSQLLTKTQLILFLNKVDQLKLKLQRGVPVKKFVTSYGDRPNEMAPVVKYIRESFRDILKKHSPEPRNPYIYPTSVINTKATASTLGSVRDGVLRHNLALSQLI